MENLSELNQLTLNQGNLQDLLECPRRFQLKALDKLSWPAAHTSKIDQFEQSTLLGNRFHLLCQQFFAKMPSNYLERSTSDPILLEMFENFIPYGESLIQYPHYSEQILMCSFSNHRLLAKFDLIVKIDTSQYLIIDWKTSSRKPTREELKKRVQSSLYPYILSQSGHLLFDNMHINPDSIKMQYWYPLCPEPEEIFPYSKQIHQTVIDDLDKMISDMEQMYSSDDIFPLTDNLEQCQYCNFRSLCNRGKLPGDFSGHHPIEQEDLSNFRFDLDQINEIEF